MEIDPDTWLAPAPDGTPAWRISSPAAVTGPNCFIPQVVPRSAIALDVVSSRPRTPRPGSSSPASARWSAGPSTISLPDVWHLRTSTPGTDEGPVPRTPSRTRWCGGPRERSRRIPLATRRLGLQRSCSRPSEEEPAHRHAVGARCSISPGCAWASKTSTKAYLYFATDTQRLADQAKFISYGPARYSSAPLVGNPSRH